MKFCEKIYGFFISPGTCLEKELPVLLNEGIGKDIGLLTAEERRINVLAQKALLELYIENGDVCDVRFIC